LAFVLLFSLLAFSLASCWWLLIPQRRVFCLTRVIPLWYERFHLWFAAGSPLPRSHLCRRAGTLRFDCSRLPNSLLGWFSTFVSFFICFFIVLNLGCSFEIFFFFRFSFVDCAIFAQKAPPGPPSPFDQLPVGSAPGTLRQLGWVALWSLRCGRPLFSFSPLLLFVFLEAVYRRPFSPPPLSRFFYGNKFTS